jgi:Tfp pilus assembly protein PilF
MTPPPLRWRGAPAARTCVAERSGPTARRDAGCAALRRPRGWSPAPPVLAALLALAIAAPARASEESQALGARAVVAINAGDDAKALTLLDQAVTLDPKDADVHYQRGVVRGRSGDPTGAIADLEAALKLRPYFPVASLELGIALTDAGRYGEAVPYLTQAQNVATLDAQASFFLGLAQLRLDQDEAARASFARASRLDPSLALATQYYDGVISYRQTDYTAAESAFRGVQKDGPTTAMAREAAQYLDIIDRSRRANYSAFGTVALEYDSNVNLGTNNLVQGSVTGKGDWRVALNGGGRYVPLRLGHFSVALSYEFFQSLQFRLHEFNLQDNRPAVQLQYDFDNVSIGMLSRYDYYLLDTDSFLQEVTAFPWVSVREAGVGRTDFYYRMQWRDYKDPGYAVLDGFYNYPGVRQFFDIGGPDQQIFVGYQLAVSTPDGTGDAEQIGLNHAYMYFAQQAEIGVRWALPFELLGEAVYRYEHQAYPNASRCFQPNGNNPDCQFSNPTSGARRSDNDSRIILSLERPLPELWEHLFVVASYFGTFNDSNKQDFQYDRQIGSLGLSVRF